MANINKKIIKEVFKDAGIERVSAEVIDSLIEDMITRIESVAKEAKIILDEDGKKTLSTKIFNFAVTNLEQ